MPELDRTAGLLLHLRSGMSGACRDNVEDALEKMQKAIDSAAKSVIPKAPNVAKKKKIDKQCASFAAVWGTFANGLAHRHEEMSPSAG